MTKFEKNIIRWIVIVVMLVFIAIGIYRAVDNRRLVLRVEQDKKVIRVLPLSKDHRETIKSKYGTNTIVIKNGKADVTKADCKNQVCVNSRKISKNGETIVCLPHKLILTVVPKGQVTDEK
jgi:hypothetical protein